MAKTDMPSPVYSASVHITSILYKCIQNQFTVQVYTKPVYCKSVHKTSLWYKCIQNQFTVQVYTKPVHRASVHKISFCTKLVYWLIMKGMYIDRTIIRNVQGRNITKVKECTGTEHYQG